MMRLFNMKLNRTFTPPKRPDWFSIGFIDNVPFHQGEYDRLLEIDIEDYERIKEWVDTKLMPYMTCKSFNEDINSYNLKRIAEIELGFYVCNGDIKYILLENNVPFKAYDLSPNTTYPICINFPKSLKSSDKLNREENMINYFENIKNSSLSIYDKIDIENDNLFKRVFIYSVASAKLPTA